MDSIPAVGTVVQINTGVTLSLSDLGVLMEHGYIWIVEKAPVEKSKLINCRSVATGLRHPWYLSELNPAPTEET